MSRVTLRFWLLELFAFVLAISRMPGGVHTDEAKYLLSIPYPHPPLLRSMFALLRDLPQQEFFIRFLIASAVLQGVWFLIDIGYVLSSFRRKALALSWLFSAAVLLQAGTVMMAPLSGLFGLFCVWLALRPKPIDRSSAPIVGCLWFFALFSAYQTVLYLPLLLGAFHAAHLSWRKKLLYLGLPMLLLGLYTLSNPLALASLVHAGTQDAPLALDLRFSSILQICIVAGSFVTTVVGIVGILGSGRADFIATLLLLLGFVALTAQDYYAILLTPVLCAGLMLLLSKRRISGEVFIPLQILSAVVLLYHFFPRTPATPARDTMRFLQAQDFSGLVLIDGPFGHEWQYEHRGFSIGRFTQTLSSAIEASASAIVCTKKTCEEDIGDGWVKMDGAPIEVWVRRST